MAKPEHDARDRELLRKIDGGSPRQRKAAIDALFRQYAPLFHRFFRRQGLDSGESDDLVQDTFVKIVRGAGTYRGEASPSAWLWSIARNTLSSAYRDAGRRPAGRPALDPEGIAADGGETVESRQLRDCVRREFSAFARRYPERAQALALIVYHGWKPKEVAVFLERTAAATREYLSQCRKILKGYLDKCRHHLA